MGPIETMLKQAWSFIEDPDKRCVLYCAQDINGNEVESVSEKACQWCSLGALGKAGGTEYNETMGDAIGYLTRACANLTENHLIGPAVYNDADVMNNPPKMYAEAIRLAAKEGV